MTLISERPAVTTLISAVRKRLLVSRLQLTRNLRDLVSETVAAKISNDQSGIALMSNASSTTQCTSWLSMVAAYYPLFLIIAGTSLNLLTLAVLCRSPFRNTKKQPAMHYMRVIAVFDILTLYGWNLDHYFSYVHSLPLSEYSISSCKAIVFISYATRQVSAWLRVFVCFDRYLTLSRLRRTRFNTSRGILIIIGCIIAVFITLNFPLLLFACFYKPDGIISANAPQYQIFPMWDYIHLCVYTAVPLVLMVVFNSGVVYHLLRIRRGSTVSNSRIHHRAVSVTLVVTTSLFLILTTPSSIAFPFFHRVISNTGLQLLDGIYFTHHTLSLPLYLITFHEFRREFLAMIFYWRRVQRRASTKDAPGQIHTVQRLIEWRKVRSAGSHDVTTRTLPR